MSEWWQALPTHIYIFRETAAHAKFHPPVREHPSFIQGGWLGEGGRVEPSGVESNCQQLWIILWRHDFMELDIYTLVNAGHWPTLQTGVCSICSGFTVSLLVLRPCACQSECAKLPARKAMEKNGTGQVTVHPRNSSAIFNSSRWWDGIVLNQWN